jgi:hypothetical protein
MLLEFSFWFQEITAVDVLQKYLWRYCRNNFWFSVLMFNVTDLKLTVSSSSGIQQFLVQDT